MFQKLQKKVKFPINFPDFQWIQVELHREFRLIGKVDEKSPNWNRILKVDRKEIFDFRLIGKVRKNLPNRRNYTIFTTLFRTAIQNYCLISHLMEMLN